MSRPKKTFLFGLGAGTALTLVFLQVWGNYLERSNTEYANPGILHPFRHPYPHPLPHAFESLPPPLLPQTLNKVDMAWKLTPMDGAPVSLAQFRGQVLFLNLWATTCGPCLEEMPGISRLYHSLKNGRIAFAAVTSEGRTDVSKFLEQNDLGVPVYLSGGEPPKGLQVPGVPTTFILDGNGNVVFTHVGALNWDDDKARTYLLNLAKRHG
ncbi:MAG TPA: TlpA disulfide reductase family protein [Terriglobales bacterium]|nr:TlpA disulfide reductase family protein [Terriglobales bacterium]